MLYCCKDYKNVTGDKKLLQRRFFVCFWCFASSFLKYKKLFRLSVSWNIRKFRFFKYMEFFRGFFFRNSFLFRKYKKFFKARAIKFHFPRYKEFFSGWIFLFFKLGKLLRVSISRNTRKFRDCFPTHNIRKAFLILEIESFISRKIRLFLRGFCFLIFQGWS